MENRVKILIADGNEEFCAHVKRRLEQVSGYEIVGTAADGQRAVELMRAAKPDVLVLDLMLSKLDGITVLKRAREMDKPPAALVLTGFMTEYGQPRRNICNRQQIMISWLPTCVCLTAVA